MNKMIRISKILILLLAVSATAFGQYTGTNPNVASDKVVVATDSIDGLAPGNAVDGSLATLASIPGGDGAWIQINLGTYHYIDGYSLNLPLDDELPLEYILQVSADESAWIDLGSAIITSDGSYSYDVVSPDPVKFVRILMTDKDIRATFAEIEIYGVEMETPAPPNAKPATNVTESGFTSNWFDSENADGYVFSVATDADFTNLVPDFDNLWVGLSVTWDVPNLNPGTEYFYKVRAYNLAGTSTFGNIISVTTEKAEQTITFDALAASIYGDSDFDLAATASSGLDVSYSSSDESVATISGSTVTILGVGTTSITAMQDGDDMYLAADPVMQDLVVNVKALTVANAMAENKVYDGNTVAVASGATLEGVVGDDVVNLTNANSGVFAQATIGTGLVVSTSMTLAGADMDNYSLSASPELMADITAKELIAMAEDKSREACADNPEFTVVYAGFVGSENESVITEEAVANCTADASSPSGQYDIAASGGSAPNYVVVPASGILTVSADVTAPTLEVQNATVQLDASNNGAINNEDVVVSSDDNCGVTETTLSQYIFTDSDVGDVNVNVTVSDAAGNQTTQGTVVTVVGHVGLEGANAFISKVYPNPTYGTIHLELNNFADELKVMDITGKTLISKSNPDKQESIDLSDYNSGIYIIQLKFGSDVLYNKVVKK